MDDDEERARRVKEWNERLQKTGTPPPRRVRLSTGKLFEVVELAEAQLAKALGTEALPAPASSTFRRLIGEAEQRCRDQVNARLLELETRVVELETKEIEQRIDLESVRRKAGNDHFEYTLEKQDLQTRIDSLERQLEAAKQRSRKD